MGSEASRDNRKLLSMSLCLLHSLCGRLMSERVKILEANDEEVLLGGDGARDFREHGDLSRRSRGGTVMRLHCQGRRHVVGHRRCQGYYPWAARCSQSWPQHKVDWNRADAQRLPKRRPDRKNDELHC